MGLRRGCWASECKAAKMTRANAEYEIAETFEIAGRGVVAVIDAHTDLSVGRSHKVEVLLPDGNVLVAQAFKEWLLRRLPMPVEKEAYLLTGLHKHQVPSGSRLRLAA
jgi:hypothetical protein